MGQDELTAVFCEAVDKLLAQHEELQKVADGCRETKRQLEQQIVEIIGQQSTIESALADEMARVENVQHPEVKKRINAILGLLMATQGGIYA